MVKDRNAVTFSEAEIKSIGVKKLASLDKEYRLVIDTADQTVLLLDQFATDVLFKVTVEVVGNG